MKDRRFFPANDRIAHTSLDGQVSLPVTEGSVLRVTVAATDLRSAPAGPRDKQLLHGWSFRVLEQRNGWAFGFDVVDGYVGYVAAADLGAHSDPTHRIQARQTHIYSEPDIKSPEIGMLSFLSEIAVTDTTVGFHALKGGGFVPAQHVAPLSWRAEDAAGTAVLFRNTPYLWGGNTGWGLDCSGLVQLALHAAGQGCARDSDLQANIGHPIEHQSDLMRGDLVFWNGHVGMMLDPDLLIHANAHHMAVAVEPLADAIARIGQKEFGAVTGFRRP